MEYRKTSVRSKVEYVFHIMKNIFEYKKGSLQGLRVKLCREKTAVDACQSLFAR